MHTHGNPRIFIGLIPLLLIVIIIGTVYAMRRKVDPRFGKNTIVRCHDGHLFTTIWIPFVSFKAIRLGMMRFQRCPVGNHLTFVIPVDPSTLTTTEKQFAYDHHDRFIA